MRIAGAIATQVARQTNERMRKEYNVPSHIPDEEISKWIGKEMAQRVFENVTKELQNV